MPGSEPPNDDIIKSLYFEVTQYPYSKNGWTRETAWGWTQRMMNLISMLKQYFDRDDPKDILWIKEYTLIYKKIQYLKNEVNEEVWLSEMHETLLILFKLICRKMDDLGYVATSSQYVKSSVNLDSDEDEIKESEKND